jgi:uncharacterized protein (DUF849 family)
VTRLLKAAINGARTRAEHPALPITPEEQALAAAGAVAAGAGAIHLHVRDADGHESLAATDVARVLAAVRAQTPGVPVGISTGAWIGDSNARLGVVAGWTVLPDFAAVNFDEAGAAVLAELLRSRGVGVEAGLPHADAAAQLVESGLAVRCLRVMPEPPEQDAAAALRSVAQVEARLDRAGVKLPRLLHGTGETVWRLIDEAAARGYDVRVGLEDTLTLPDGAPARDNAELVRAALGRLG